uniref:Uncharacterized protein n=1 Tax=Trichinella nativa TaxID=6335 RepID=A0A0V1KIJ5_9BILA
MMCSCHYEPACTVLSSVQPLKGVLINPRRLWKLSLSPQGEGSHDVVTAGGSSLSVSVSR